MILGFRCECGHEWVETSYGVNEETGSEKFSGKCEKCGEYAKVAHDLAGRRYE